MKGVFDCPKCSLPRDECECNIVSSEDYDQVCKERDEIREQSKRRKHQHHAAMSELTKWKSWAREARALLNKHLFWMDGDLERDTKDLLAMFPVEAKHEPRG